MASGIGAAVSNSASTVPGAEPVSTESRLIAATMPAREWDRRGGLRAQLARPLEIERADEPSLHAPLHDLQRFVLRGEVGPGNVELPLCEPRVDVVQCDFGGDRELCRMQVGLDGCEVGRGRLHRAALSAEQVEFVAGVEARVVVVRSGMASEPTPEPRCRCTEIERRPRARTGALSAARACRTRAPAASMFVLATSACSTRRDSRDRRRSSTSLRPVPWKRRLAAGNAGSAGHPERFGGGTRGSGPTVHPVATRRKNSRGRRAFKFRSTRSIFGRVQVR